MSKVQKSYLTPSVRAVERNPVKSQSNAFFVAFWERKSEARNRKESKKASVMVRMTHRTKLANYATGVSCCRGDLDHATLKVQDQPVATLLLQDLKAKINGAAAEFRLTGRPLDIKAIWQVANGQSLNANTPNVYGCLDLFFEQIQTQEQTGEFGPTTTTKINGWHKHIKAFVKHQYSTHLALDEIVPNDAKRLLLFLKKETTFSQNYAAGIVQHFKRVLNYAIENEWIDRNPFLNYRRKLEKIVGEILTESEIDQIINAKIFSPILDHIRHVFLFQTYTGLAYCDLARATIDNVLKDERTGQDYIKIFRKKSKTESIIPLVTEARYIIDSFSNHPQRVQKGVLIPIISNQKYNNYLKQISGIIGMSKCLTTHVARRTAATYYLTKGVPMESVSAMLGHTNTLTTQKHYAITRPERVINDFKINNIELSKAV